MRRNPGGLHPAVSSGFARPASDGRSAFTLLEILLALALIGLLSAGLIAGAVRALAEAPQSPVQVFWIAVREARAQALENQTEVRLRFDQKAQAFELGGENAKHTFSFVAEREVTVDFLPPATTRSAVLIGGVLLETRGMPGVTFYPDGTCTAFRAQIRESGPPQILSIDPWTCAPVLTSDDGYRS